VTKPVAQNKPAGPVARAPFAYTPRQIAPRAAAVVPPASPKSVVSAKASESSTPPISKLDLRRER
jgi:hypothetical protein